MNIYKDSLISIENFGLFSINITKKSLIVDGKHLIKDGKFDYDLGISKCSVEEFIENAEKLYHDYKFSVPSEKSKYRRRFLYAIDEEELPTNYLITGKNRDIAQFDIEYYILCSILNGTITKENLFKDEDGKDIFYWQSKKEKDLIIYKHYL